jgi:hypothetical protein
MDDQINEQYHRNGVKETINNLALNFDGAEHTRKNNQHVSKPSIEISC